MKLQQLKNMVQDLLLFDKETLRTLEPNEQALNQNIKYWLSNGELIQIKKGVYTLQERYLKLPSKQLYHEYLAGQILAPSYLSGEYVMAKHQLLSESVAVITCVTTQTTREISNQFGTFIYRSICKKLFCSYKCYQQGEMVINIASKEKAIFDYLYLLFLRDFEPSEQVIKSLRINWELVELKEFQLIVSFLQYTNSVQVKRAFQLINSIYFENRVPFNE